MLIRKESFRITFSQLFSLILLAIVYSSTGLFLFWSYMYISSGIATTIHYLYPVLVTGMMIFFFREKSSIWIFLSVVLAIAGVALLSWGEGGMTISLRGLAIVLVSVFAYALYIVAVNKLGIKSMGVFKFTFYILLIGSFFFLFNALAKDNLQPLQGGLPIFNVVMLALIPTVISNITLVNSIKYVGSTTTAVLGAMEPVAAVMVGVAVFGEPFTLNVFGGIVLILVAVTLVILAKDLSKLWKRIMKPVRIKSK